MAEPTKVTEITSELGFQTFANTVPATALLVVYFHAPWAAPCKQMATVLDTLASTYPAQSPPAISFVSINAEEVPEVSEQFDVTAVPFIVLLRGGARLETISGSDAAKVRAAVERHAAPGGAPGGQRLPPAQQVVKKAEDTTLGDVGSTTNGALGARGNETAPIDSTGEQDKEALFARLKDLVKAAPVMLFMKGTPSAPQCGFSRQTVALLRQKNVRYGFFNILADDDVRQGLKEYADWPTFPQLWVDGELVGGLDIVREEFENNDEFLTEYSTGATAAA
ncbi:glutaredoxin [Eremomyces bilateralis CBS 781.70]|uniref:Glutaredoxin n=1 Tax=Eremomyces bilateralis CBS 781.70 TaxID=1392243 RepID=A0A6G1G6I6_9PEZI|nr:glutaredoxin [Eremomyces bilateralis CBS 781.70]KAF1813663.1 glutaredoxin [Eremomyces bilateralis CBS 781.70]